MIRENNRPVCQTIAARRLPLRRTIAFSVLAALGCASTTASALETDFGVEYKATGFYVGSDSFDTDAPTANGQRLDDEIDPSDYDSGFAHLLRLKADFKHEATGIALKTSIELAGDRFTGQDRGYTPTAQRAFNRNSRGDNVRLDLAFFEIPFTYGLARVGRQESNWNNCFLTCQDRRDRLLLLTRIGSVTPFFAYDRTADGAGFQSEADGDEIFTGFVAPIGGWELGFLYVHFFNNFSGNIADTDPALIDTDGDGIPDAAAPGSVGARNVQAQSGLDIFSPYIQGSVGPINVSTGVNYFFDNGVENNLTPEDGDIFTDSSLAGYFRLGADIGMFELNAQYVGAHDGGFIDAGFDTYSSLINNNPDSYQNPTSVYSMGGFNGREGYDQDLYIGSVKINVTDKAYVRGALGFLDISIPAAPGSSDSDSDTSTVYDLEAGYQFNEALRTWATLGMIKENDVGALSGNGLLAPIPNNGSFAQDRVVAGSVNLGIEF